MAAMGAIVAAVLTCTLLIDRFVRDEAHQQATRFLQTNAEALRDALDRGMAQHYEEMHVIAQLDQIATSSDATAARRALEQLRASFPQFTWLGLTDASGKVLAASDGLLEGMNVSARPWFSGAQHGSFVGDVHRAVLLEKLLPAQSEPWRFVDIAVPVRGPQGEMRGVLGVHLSWTWAGKIKRELVDQAIAQHQAEALVLSADGTVLLGAPELQGKKLPVQPDLLVVESATHGSGRYPGLGWKVVLRQPESVAMAPFHALQKRTLFAAAALCLLLAPLVRLLARRIAGPLWELTRRLEANQPVTPTRNLLYREAEYLTDALARHAQRQEEDASRLRELNATLEARVTERTAALAQTNEELLRAIAAAEAAQEQLILTARTDTLTGLPNRLSFNERLAEALARSRRHGQPLALLFLDVDKFKLINDTLGHAAGDQVLKQFAQRVRGCVRECDTVARLAGDEFVVILEDLHTPAEPQFVARKVIAAVNRSFELEEGLWDVSTSIGIAYHDVGGQVSPAALLAAADKALYEAKASGRNGFRLAAV